MTGSDGSARDSREFLIASIPKDSEDDALQSGTRVRSIAYSDLPLWLRARLTRFEREALRLSLDGLSSAQIAEEVGGSERVIAGRLDSAYRRMGVRSRTELIQLINKTGRYSTN